MNNLLVIDNALSNEQCDVLLNESHEKLTESFGPPRNYSYYEFPASHQLCSEFASTVIKEYIKKYPEINSTFDPWGVDHYRVKKFSPGQYYEAWHCEHSIRNPLRLAACILYLSDHNCGTEFMSGEMVKSKKGRAIMFPAFWTHFHRGQPCPENKHRHIMSFYLTYIK